MIFTELSPNTQKDDFKLALKALCNPAYYNKGRYSQEVKEWFKNIFKVRYVASYESARTALYLLLKELGIKEDDEVIVQAFTCVAAVNPIKWAGARVVFVDIDPSNFNLDIDDLVNKVNERTKAIIVQHTFGYPAKIKEIVEFAESRGICVIEDCAHTIGTELDGEILGTFGDAAIFSLGRDKAISASFGGIAITNKKELGKSLEEGENFLSFPSKKWVARQISYTIVAYLTRVLYDNLSLGKLIHFIFSKLGILLKATTLGEKKEGKMPGHAKSRMPNAFAEVVLNQLKKLETINRKRREFMHLYMKRLEKLGLDEVKLPDWRIGKHFFPIRFPLLVKRRDELLKFVEDRGVLLGNWYDIPVAPRGVDLTSTGYKQGSCPNAEEVCENVVNLPLHVNLAEEDALKVVAIIRDFYE